MSIQVGDNFTYKGQKPLDARLVLDTIPDMVATPSTIIYDGILVYVLSEKKFYTYNSANTVDAILNKWRELTTSSITISTAIIDNVTSSPTYGHLILTLSDGTNIDCGDATGLKGDKGDGFAIIKLYTSTADMLADATPVNDGQMVAIIDSSTTPITAKVYIRNSAQVANPTTGDENGYTFFCNLADATVIQGPKGNKGDKGDTPVITITTVPATATKPEGKEITFTTGTGATAMSTSTIIYNGINLKTAAFNASNELILTLTDGSIINLGVLSGTGGNNSYITILGCFDTPNIPAVCNIGDIYFNTDTNMLYKCSVANTWDATGSVPTNTDIYISLSDRNLYTYADNTWQSYGGGSGTNFSAVLKQFEPNHLYTQDEMIVEDGKIYTRITAGTSLSNFGADIDNWKLVTILNGNNSGRYVKFKATSNSTTNSTGWQFLKNFVYVDGDKSLIDETNGTFTAPVSGMYYMNFNSITQNSSTSANLLSLIKNGTNNDDAIMESSSTGFATVVGLCCLTHLDKGDTLRFRMYKSSSVNISNISNTPSEFGLIAPDGSESLVAEAIHSHPTSIAATTRTLTYSTSTLTSVINPTTGEIILPEDGIYILDIDTLLSNNGTAGRCDIRIYDKNGAMIKYAETSNVISIQLISCTAIITGAKGDKFVIKSLRTTNQSGLTYTADYANAGIHLYRLKSSEIKLTPKDFYNQYAIDNPTSSMTYEDWAESQIRQNNFRVEAKLDTYITPTTSASIISNPYTYVSGDSSLLNDYKFVAPLSGVYYLRALPYKKSSNTGHLKTYIYKNAVVGGSLSGNQIISSNQTGGYNQAAMDTIDSVFYLNKGEFVVLGLYSSNGTAGNVEIRQVEFGLLQGGAELMQKPNIWVPGVEYSFGDGLYGIRTKGNFSNNVLIVVPASSNSTNIISWGGSVTNVNGNRWAVPAAMSGAYYEIYKQGTAQGNPYYLQYSGNGSNPTDADIWVLYVKD